MANNFSSSISEVINGKGTKAAKIRTLVSVFGLRPVEASVAYDVYYEHTPIAHREVFKYTFGVEIECLFKREGVYSAMRESGVNFADNHGSYYHTNGNTSFEFKRDGSIHNDRSHEGYEGIEMVTSVLRSNSKGADSIKSLEKACKALNANNARVNKSTGLHVHIGVENMGDTQYVNVFKNYQMLETLIDSFMAVSRRADNNYYCGTLAGHDYSQCVTKQDVRSVHNYDRYHKVNTESWAGHKTIEFRQHQGTTDFKKISNWVSFCAKLVNFSKDNTFMCEVTSIDEIPFLTKAEKDFFKARQQELA